MFERCRYAALPGLVLLALGCRSQPDETAPSPEPSIATSASPPAPPATTPAAEPAVPVASIAPAAAPAPSAATPQQPATAASPPPASGAYSGDQPCTRKTFKTAQVRSACQTGGRPAVKTLMKNMVGKAKAAGESIKCTSCHVDTKSFDLKDNAVTDLKKWL